MDDLTRLLLAAGDRAKLSGFVQHHQRLGWRFVTHHSRVARARSDLPEHRDVATR